MKAIEGFALLWMFLYIAFIFPILQTEVQNATLTSNVGSVISAFPLIILVVSISVPIYLGVKEATEK